MLPAPHSASLDLPAAIEETRRRHGAHGVVDLLLVALTDRRLRSDADIDEHLSVLKSACRQTRRYRELGPVLRRIATIHPERRYEMAVEAALVHAHVGEFPQAIAMLASAIAQQRGLAPAKRSLSFAVAAEVAAVVLGRFDLAAECAELSRSSAVAAPRPARGVVRPNSLAAGAVPAHAPSLRRGRAKGPIRQLSVLGAAPGSAGADGIAGTAGPSKLLRLVVDGAAA